MVYLFSKIHLNVPFIMASKVYNTSFFKIPVHFWTLGLSWKFHLRLRFFNSTGDVELSAWLLRVSFKNDQANFKKEFFANGFVFLHPPPNFDGESGAPPTDATREGICVQICLMHTPCYPTSTTNQDSWNLFHPLNLSVGKNYIKNFIGDCNKLAIFNIAQFFNND